MPIVETGREQVDSNAPTPRDSLDSKSAYSPRMTLSDMRRKETTDDGQAGKSDDGRRRRSGRRRGDMILANEMDKLCDTSLLNMVNDLKIDMKRRDTIISQFTNDQIQRSKYEKGQSTPKGK